MARKEHPSQEPEPTPTPADAPVAEETPEAAAAEAPAAPETTALEAEIAALKGRVAALEGQIAEKDKQVEQERSQYLRTLADFQNFRRRSEDQGREQAQFSNRELILGLLPVLDNFERALAAAEKNQSYEALIGGIALTQRQIIDYLKKNGIEPIEAVGQQFDPNFHEAVARLEDSEHPENMIVEELQRGYTMHTRVLRPALVKVAT